MEGDLIDFNDNWDPSSFEKYTPSLLNLNIDLNSTIPSLNGRESLGILNNSFIEKELTTSEVFLSDNSSCQRNSFGNRNQIIYDFNFPNIDYLTSNSKFSIDSNSISRIYSLTNGSTLNNAFLEINSFNNALTSKHMTIPLQRNRIKSLPSDFIRNKRFLQTVTETNSEPDIKDHDKKKNTEIIDLLYVEARSVADKIADGSIFDDSGEGGTNLNATSEPVFKDIVEDELTEKEFQCKDIFKSVDKMLPPVLPPSSSTPDDTNTVNNNNNIVLVKDEDELLKETNDSASSPISSKCDVCLNLIKLLQNNICDNGKHTNANELLSNLTELVKLENRNEKELNECYNLMVNLLHLLGTTSAESSKDIVVNADSSDGLRPLDLSLKSNSGLKENVSPLVVNNKGTTLKNLIHNDVQQRPLKLKPKKISDSKLGSNKGPLKAIAPMTNCLKTKDDDIKLTELSLRGNLPNIGRSSTPCNPKLKPIAQSTPENDHTKPHLSDNSIKTSDLHSPVSRKNSSINMRYHNEKENLSNNNNSNSLSKSLSRRGSTSDIKRDNANKFIKRSNSIGDSTTTTAAATRARDMVTKKLASYQHNNALKRTNQFLNKSDNNNKTGLTENKRVIKSNLKPFSLISKLKIGKENAVP